MGLKYEDLKLPYYRNTTSLGILGGENIILQDLVAAGLFAGLNFFFRGKKSTGKTQLMRDVFNSYFGGSENGLWENGRPDFKPKDLFESLNISLAKGSIENIPEIKAVYSPDNKVEYLISSCEKKNGKLKIEWKKISAEEKEKIENLYSITTEDLKKLKNIQKKFFIIDEYNRCPEVIMNMFYGLMTGEIHHDGDIITLGNGYYSGIAASNPEEYEGTFEMDPAMWSRFHLVVDFDAFPPGIKDEDELNKRNLSPNIQNSTRNDISQEIENAYKQISALKPTLDERVIMQYLQNGLNHCSKYKASKNHLQWPTVCLHDCEKGSTLCGTLSGIDRRAVSSIYRLAKALEIVAKMKKETAKIDPIDSLLLAYKFVTPYKGVVSQRVAKDKNSIEGLVLEDVSIAIADTVKSMISNMKELAEAYVKVEDLKEHGMEIKLPELRKLCKDKGMEEKYLKIRADKEREFGAQKELPMEEILKKSEYKQKLIDFEKEILQQIILENPEKHKLFLDSIQEISKSTYNKLINLKKITEWTENDYQAEVKEQRKESYKDFISKSKEDYNDSLLEVFKIIADYEGVRSMISDKLGITAEIKKEALKSVQKEVDFNDKIVFMVPAEKEEKYQNSVKEKTIELLIETVKEEANRKRKTILNDEWRFLEIFLDDYIEQAKNERARSGY